MDAWSKGWGGNCLCSFQSGLVHLLGVLYVNHMSYEAASASACRLASLAF
jgi:hypothetical protein